jgi:hypothetical protein
LISLRNFDGSGHIDAFRSIVGERGKRPFSTGGVALRAVAQALVCCHSRSAPHGVYQIGEVYARSWMVIVISSGISIPKRTASSAVHWGVGISINRT